MQDVYKSLLAKDGRYLEYISTEEAVQNYEELLVRFEKLDEVFAVQENSSIATCEHAMMILNYYCDNEKAV